MSVLLCQPERPKATVMRWFTENNVSFRSEVSIGHFRVDFVAEYEKFILLLETDEDQHRGYPVEKEHARTTELLTKLNEMVDSSPDQRPVLVVRFNPDSKYLVGEVTHNPSLANRLRFLDGFLQRHEPHPRETVAWYYYCYDVDNFQKVISPFVAGHDHLKRFALTICGDPNSVETVPEKQVRAEQRVAKRLDQKDSRDFQIDALEIKVQNLRSALATKRQIDVAEASESVAKRQRQQDQLQALVRQEVRLHLNDNGTTAMRIFKPALAKKTEKDFLKPGRGGIYVKKDKKGVPSGYTIQYWIRGELQSFFLGRLQLGFDDAERTKNILRERATALGLSASAIEKSFVRLKL